MPALSDGAQAPSVEAPPARSIVPGRLFHFEEYAGAIASAAWSNEAHLLRKPKARSGPRGQAVSRFLSFEAVRRAS